MTLFYNLNHAIKSTTNQIKKNIFRSKYSLVWGSIFFLIVLSSGIIRFYNLGFESLWIDEIDQVKTYSLPISKLVTSAATIQQPPLDFFIGFCIDRLGLGQNDWWVRFPAAVFGVGAVILIIWWCKRMFGNYAALAAGIILTVSPLHVRMSQEARPYTIFVFFAILCLILFATLLANKNKLKWIMFSTTLFLLLLTRWVGPIVVTLNLLIYISLYLIYENTAVTSHKHEKLIKIKPIIISFAIPIIIYMPFFANIYINSSKYLPKNSNKNVLMMLNQMTTMIKLSTTDCFSNVWILYFIVAGLALIATDILYQERKKNIENNYNQLKFIDMTLFLFSMTSFIFIYVFVFVYNTNVVSKPQYLLILAPMGAVCLGVLADKIRASLFPYSKTFSLIIYVLSVSIICIPMYNKTTYELATRQKRDWRGVGEVVSKYQESIPPLFLSITNAFTAWSPRIYSIPRYIKDGSNNMTIRDLASKKFNHELKFGTIYAVVYKNFHGSFPVTKLKPPKDMQIYDFKGLLLYRFPGTAENSTQRLILLLSYLASGADKGDGLVEIYLAMAQTLITLGDIEHAKSSVIGAFNQCKNQNERNYFLATYDNILKSFGL